MVFMALRGPRLLLFLLNHTNSGIGLLTECDSTPVPTSRILVSCERREKRKKKETERRERRKRKRKKKKKKKR
jgi:hypothetical protein